MTTTIVMFGVSGTGKTTVMKLLAEKLKWVGWDADDEHSALCKEKMKIGDPLTDADREEWLNKLQTKIIDFSLRGINNTLACSALKVKYRQHLKNGHDDAKFVFLNIDIETVKERFRKRNEELLLNDEQEHFMNPLLIQSQFDILETAELVDLTLDATLPPEILVNQIIDKL